MAKRIYVGVGNTARRVKKAYVGINGIARRIKKAYIGVGGVARPCFSTELEYWGETPQPLISGADNLAAAKVGDYAVFGGGTNTVNNTSLYLSAVTAYNKALVRSLPDELSVARTRLAAASVGGYAIFAGGMYRSQNGKQKNSSVAEAYDTSLTRKIIDSLDRTTYDLIGTQNTNYAMFIMGDERYSTSYDAYDASLTHVVFKTVVPTVYDCIADAAAAGVGNYVLFGGGYRVSQNKVIGDMFSVNLSLTTQNATALSESRRGLEGAGNKKYAIFAGGRDKVSDLRTVDAYNESLTRTSATELSESYSSLGVGVGGYALFVTTISGYGQQVGNVDTYDEALTHTNNIKLKYSHILGASVSVGGFALFGGGFTPKSHGSEIEAITV